MSDRVPMTQEGYNKIKAEVEHMEGVLMPEITKKIAEARAEGDLKENAEYHAQRDNQGMLQGKINQLKSKLAMAQIVDTSTIPTDQIAFGAKIKIVEVGDDDEEEITLVGAGEEDYDNGKYLITSPLGQGLLGKKVGEIAEIEVPKGMLKYEVLEITYDH